MSWPTAPQSRRFNARITAARIRALKDVPRGGELTPELEYKAFETASAQLEKEMLEHTSINQLRKSVTSNLSRLLEREDFDRAAHELLLETIVIIWGAFEVFVTEIVKSLVNVAPGIAIRLLSSETKKHFPSKGVPVEALADHNFNLSQSMGNVLFDERHLDSLPVIRDVLDVVFQNDTRVAGALSGSALYMLAQRRHLIVHRRAEVDSAYRLRTGDQTPAGQKIQIRSEYIYESLNTIRDVAIAILAATDRFGTPEFIGAAKPR